MNISSTETSYLTLSLALQYANALEGENHDTAAKVLESALKWSTKMLPDAQRGFFVAASCFQGIFRNNASPAEAWLESARKVKGAVPQPDWDSMALASILLAKASLPKPANISNATSLF